MSTPICHHGSPLLHRHCSCCLSPIIYMRWAPRCPPIPPRFCLTHWKGITVPLYSHDNVVSRRNISPCKAAQSACWEASLSVPFIEVITDFMSRWQERGESAPPPPAPPPPTVHSPRCVCRHFYLARSSLCLPINGFWLRPGRNYIFVFFLFELLFRLA